MLKLSFYLNREILKCAEPLSDFLTQSLKATHVSPGYVVLCFFAHVIVSSLRELTILITLLPAAGTNRRFGGTYLTRTDDNGVADHCLNQLG